MIPPFEIALEQLIDTYVECGTSLEDMISTLELKTNALEEQLNDANGDEE